MKKCLKCNFTYNTERFTCPFCKSRLEESSKSPDVETIHQEYPKFKDRIKKVNMTKKVFVFLSLITIMVLLVTNYYEYKKGVNSLWSIIVTAGILSLWTLINGIIIYRNNAAKKTFNFGMCLCLLMVSIEYLSVPGKETYSHWSVSYVIPFILVAILTSINLLVIIRRKKSFTKYIGYQFWTSVLLILYHLLYIFKINTCLWTSTMCFMYGLVTIIAIFFFGGKATKEEFKKRFII